MEEKLILRLTLNPGLALTGFRTTRPWDEASFSFAVKLSPRLHYPRGILKKRFHSENTSVTIHLGFVLKKKQIAQGNQRVQKVPFSKLSVSIFPKSQCLKSLQFEERFQNAQVS